MSFKILSVDDGYGNPYPVAINADQISIVEQVAVYPPTDPATYLDADTAGSAIIHVHGQLYIPTDMSYNEVLTKLGATALNA